ncbi:MAG: carboxypeptidase-like regulatory domain-containing protein [Tannerellaceae bacterium]|nr:carboxypeptidase-like regulatory domain-containing protein [Tannerellaceae bacterium]
MTNNKIKRKKRKSFLTTRITYLFILLCCLQAASANQRGRQSVIKGIIKSSQNELLGFATIYIKDTNLGTQSDEKGEYFLRVTPGKHILCAQVLGYTPFEKEIEVAAHDRLTIDIVLEQDKIELGEVEVVAKSLVQQVNETAYNVVAVDAKALHNSTLELAHVLDRVSGIKIKETGGVGSDMQLMMDGFSGKHIKIFVDGVPQEGVGSSFGLNNIPINYAERIEVYKGVVPVGFGTDAIGGVINIITKKNQNKWFLDASYSYGSFNTHKSYVNFGQTFKNGLTYEINTFQNYSDNSYYVDTPVKDFETGAIDKSQVEHVKRFHDTYHNEAIIGKVGLVDKIWADRLMFGITYSKMHKDIQTGVRQEVVFGGKYRTGYSVMPSLEYRKRNLLAQGLDVTLTANYNKNITENIDTSNYEFNWRGEKRILRSPGEQSYQHTRSDNNNWNGAFTANYRLGKAHTFTLNHVINAFERSNKTLLNSNTSGDAISKETRKNITGLSYRLMPVESWNVSVFGKYYNQFIAGPIAVTSAQDEYTRTTNSVSSLGYGAAGTYFILKSIQAKLSYEKAYRLPTNEEMFGDEDLETGDLAIKPENSDNLNLNLSYNETFGKHFIFVEGGLVYRNIKDYIQRKLVDLSGGKSGATYENHGRVLTKGYNISARYGFGKWVSLGGTFTQMNVRDNVKTIGSETLQENLTYGARMPNIPYRFANADATFYWRDLGEKGNVLSLSYNNFYMHSFPLYSEALGSKSDFIVPTQFSHDITVSYGIKNGRYNISFECRNFTNEKLYDNFSLQKAGRAFYGKIRVYLGN